MLGQLILGLLTLAANYAVAQAPIDSKDSTTKAESDAIPARSDDQAPAATTEAAEPDQPTAPKSERPPSPLQSDIETLYVRDADGELVPVLNMSFEDFQRLYKLDRKLTLPQMPPAYSLEQMNIDGVATNKKAELKVNFRVKLLKDGFARIPLRMRRAVLTKPATFTGDGEHVLTAPDPKGGFVLWVKGASGSTHEVQLSVSVPFAVVNKESRLELSLPRATASQLTMIVNGRFPNARIEGAGRLLPRKPVEKRRSLLTVAGLAGEFNISWGATSKSAAPPKIIEAKGTIEVQVVAPGVVSTSALFTITSSGRDLSSVRIRLPKNSIPSKLDDANYTTEFIATGADKNTSGTGAPIALVKLNEPTRGPFDIRLKVEQRHPPTSGLHEPMNVLDFEVVDAVTHAGEVYISGNSDWLVRWEDAGLRRVAGSESLGDANLIAKFEYYRQPAQLPIRIYKKETRVSVQPAYLIDVQPTQVKLDATLKFRVRGAPASDIDCDFSGWKVTSIGEPGLIREDAIRIGEVSPLRIPLKTARRGDFTVKITATKKLEAEPTTDGVTPLVMQLPDFPGSTMAPAIVVVNPADNLTLTGTPTTNAFDAEPLPNDMQVPQRERAPQCYIYRGDPSTTRLAYDIKRRKQSISVDIQNRVAVEKKIAKTVQEFNYNVRYEPIESLRLSVPRQLANAGTLRIIVDNEEVDINAIKRPKGARPDDSGLSTELLPNPTNDQSNIEDDALVWDIPLPQPRLGQIKLRLSYIIPGDQAIAADGAILWTCFFSAPMTGNQRLVTLSVDAPENWVAELLDDDPWTQLTTPESQLTDKVRVAADSQPDRATIAIRQVVFEQSKSVVVERVLVQSWLGKDQRQDRTTFLLSAVTSPIEVQLPNGADWKAAYVLVNGKTSKPTIKNGAMSIELPTPTPSNLRLEVAYPFQRRPKVGHIEMKMAAVAGASWIRELYWQVVTPAHEHMIWSSDRFALHNNWSSNQLYWRRQPELDQVQLELWADASTQSPPPEGSNTYLFAGFGESRALQIRTATRRTLLLAGSGASLSFFFFWQLVPAAVRRFSVIPIAVTLLALAVLNSSLAVLFCQAAALGVALAALSRLLHWLIPPARIVKRPMSTSVFDSRAATKLAPRSGSIHSTDSFQVTMPTPE